MKSENYQLLDSGNLLKLEQVGPYRLSRPALNAFWKPSLPQKEWDKANAHFLRNPQSGGGKWISHNSMNPPPNSWNVRLKGIQLMAKPTNFGHLGFFPEHASLWDWIHKQLLLMPPSAPILNLFAYTGAMSLFLAEKKSKPTHCDAAQGINEWAKENLKLNPSIPNNIRWITDDAFKFAARESRKNSLYNGIILDPPSFGRGAQGQVWKIEDQLPILLEHCKQLLNPHQPRFIILTCHTPGFTPLILSRILHTVFYEQNFAAIEAGELTILQSNGFPLPAGSFARLAMN